MITFDLRAPFNYLWLSKNKQGLLKVNILYFGKFNSLFRIWIPTFCGCIWLFDLKLPCICFLVFETLKGLFKFIFLFEFQNFNSKQNAYFYLGGVVFIPFFKCPCKCFDILKLSEVFFNFFHISKSYVESDYQFVGDLFSRIIYLSDPYKCVC